MKNPTERSLWIQMLTLLWELACILASFAIFLYLIVALFSALSGGHPVTNTVLLVGILYLGMAIDRKRTTSLPDSSKESVT
jgi:hypothetical protein